MSSSPRIYVHERTGNAILHKQHERARSYSTQMSSSPPYSTRPSDATLEQALRYAVQKVYKSGNLDNLTVKRIRKSVESELGLEEEFFKTDGTWTSKSKLVIQAEVVRV